MDPTKGLFRRRPSTASTRSRLRTQSSTTTSLSAINNGDIATAQSCPTSPKHSPLSRRSIGEPRIPEDEEAHHSPTTSSEAAQYAAAIDAAKNEQMLAKNRATTTNVRTPRVSSAGSRLTADNYRPQQRRDTSDGDNNITTNAGGAMATVSPSKAAAGPAADGGIHLQRSASTVSGLAVRPRSSPAGLYSYTGSVPSSVHGSRVDLRTGDTDKGSAIYLGCSAPRNSTLSLSSRGSSGGSAPSSPARTPPVSPRNNARRATSLVKRQR